MIRIDHVSKSFGGLAVLKDISLEIGKGEVAAIIGPSGAGKKVRGHGPAVEIFYGVPALLPVQK